MDKVLKPSDSEGYAPSSESFIFRLLMLLSLFLDMSGCFSPGTLDGGRTGRYHLLLETEGGTR
jgi:hypothetical protein